MGTTSREGQITAILGPSNCGKTNRLIQYGAHYESLNLRVLFASAQLQQQRPQPNTNVRCPNNDTVAVPLTPPPPPRTEKVFLKSITEIYNIADQFDALLVDDAHFIHDFSDGALNLAQCGKHVIFTALNSSKDGESWPSLTRVTTCADYFEHLTCPCYRCMLRNACMSYRLVSQPDMYSPVCRDCYRLLRAHDSPVVSPPSAEPTSPQRKLSSGNLAS